MDIGLDDGAGDAEYLATLENRTQRTLALTEADLAIYLAGADPHEGDLLGHFALSKKRRNYPAAQPGLSNPG